MKILKLIFVILIINSNCKAQLWSGLNGRISSVIARLYNDTANDLLYLSGSFTKLNDTISCRGIAAWDGINFHTLGLGFEDFGVPNSNYAEGPMAMINYKNKLYCGGGFIKAGNILTKYIATWSNNQWDSLPVKFDDTVIRFNIIDDKLYISGGFKKVGNLDVEQIVVYDGNAFQALPSFYPYQATYISDVAIYNGSLYACGFITDSTGWPQGVMKLQNGHWTPAGGGIHGSIVDMGELLVYKNKLLATGLFYSNAGNNDDFIMSWNDTTWQSVGGGTGIYNGLINTMEIHNETLYCVGVFTEAGGVPASKFATWDGTNWCSKGISVINNNLVGAAFYHDTIYVSGAFQAIAGDSSIKYVAKYLGGGYTENCGNTTIFKELNANNQQITIYPNPATTQLYINTSNKANITITNILGVETLNIKNQNANTPIDISTLANGIYNITIQTNTKLFNTKFIKQ